jgi:hypothetical protein
MHSLPLALSFLLSSSTLNGYSDYAEAKSDGGANGGRTVDDLGVHVAGGSLILALAFVDGDTVMDVLRVVVEACELRENLRRHEGSMSTMQTKPTHRSVLILVKGFGIAAALAADAVDAVAATIDCFADARAFLLAWETCAAVTDGLETPGRAAEVGLATTGLDDELVMDEQLCVAGNRCVGQNSSLHF